MHIDIFDNNVNKNAFSIFYTSKQQVSDNCSQIYFQITNPVQPK